MFSSAFQRVYDVDSLYLYVCGLDINVSPDIMPDFSVKPGVSWRYANDALTPTL